MSQREVFPYPQDRDAINCMLRGIGQHPRHQAVALTWTDGTSLKIPGTVTTILFYDTAGALCGILLSGSDYHYSEKIINAAMDMMGNHNDRVVREDHGFGVDAVVANNVGLRVFKYYFAGTPVNLGQPFVIAGPLSIQAWRAQTKHR